ncbi:cysteine-rich receptor-like protein kinase 10 [Gastrolobium bilobum]|uniref:cysteine-rich receptor-like protein kinase 10 n=1 Tax=Gastrolobium bilobum TaxID=150636 RepID=UPI002AB02132|nr:cysteine-rich receptor-like protein kinase 10 [Gastrolobium bilobum]
MIHSLMVSKSIQFFLLLCSLAFLSEVAFADPPYEICSTSSNYENGSSFQNNLNNLLFSLPSNASISKSYNTSFGVASDKVYGLYMCLDYVSNETCKNCIATAIEDIVKLCPQAEEAVVWEEVCQLRYSNKNFMGRLNVTGNIGKDNQQNISEPEKFQYAVNKILSNITDMASFNVSANVYATGEVPFEDKIIYALVQCSRDLSANDCNSCLQSAIKDIPGCCYGSIGARVLSRSCYLRYEFYPFYLGASETTGSSSGSYQRSKHFNSSKIWMITGIIVVVGLVTILSICCLCFFRNKRNKQRRNGKICEDLPYIDLGSLCVATQKFSDLNKLGQGGFGPVYKGILSDGQEVAIKRLSTCSEQGSDEFINEVMLIMKLQHKNLVKLLGFCVDGEEKLLVYEFLPNGSLDVVLFEQRARLDWTKRLDIISGIARGILYLHEDSRLKIIHRDLKASNVLLDYDMNPKISDFGMARIFAGSEGEANTSTIVGTYGYMAPEYAMEGLYSIKSDVFCFGVLLLEIITGKRNAGFYHSKNTPSLLSYAWHLWNEGKGLELKDPLLFDSCPEDQFLRYMNIGLLCVQEDAYDRPTMSSVVLMLKNESAALGQPERPPFSVGRFMVNDLNDQDYQECSVNFLTVSDILPQ